MRPRAKGLRLEGPGLRRWRRKCEEVGIRKPTLFTADRHIHTWSLDPLGLLRQPFPGASHSREAGLVWAGAPHYVSTPVSRNSYSDRYKGQRDRRTYRRKRWHCKHTETGKKEAVRQMDKPTTNHTGPSGLIRTGSERVCRNSYLLL